MSNQQNDALRDLIQDGHVLCNYCNQEVISIGFDDEAVDFCQSCDIQVEGNTHAGVDDEI